MNNFAPIGLSDTHDRNSLEKIFVAAPMSGFDSEPEYEIHRQQSLKLVESMKEAGFAEDVYYAGTQVTSASTYSGSNTAFHLDVGNLLKSELMVFLYPRKVASGALVEVGIAIGRGIPLVIVVKDRSDLPYMIRDIEDFEDPDKFAPAISIIETENPLSEINRIGAFIKKINSDC